MKSRSPRRCPKQSNGDHELVLWELLNYLRMQTQCIFMAAGPASDEKALWENVAGRYQRNPNFDSYLGYFLRKDRREL